MQDKAQQRRSSLTVKDETRGARNSLAGDAENKNFGALMGQSAQERALNDDDPPLGSRLMSEFVGTGMLVFVVGVSTQSKVNFLAPVAIGLILAIQIYTFGAVSGGMFNPAVTLSVVLSGRDKILPATAALYMLVQFLGGIVGGSFAFAVTDKTFCFDWEANPGSQGFGTSFLLEALYTAALCGTVLSAGTSFDVPNQYFGFAIGLCVTASAMACYGLDQGSFNPAVTLGIQWANTVNGSNGQTGCDPGDWLLFLFVPFLGSILAAGIFRGTRSKEYPLLGEEVDAGRPTPLLERLLAELVGTFFLVYTVGVAVTGGGPFAALAIGLMLGVQIYTFGSVSGACFNPAVTLAVLLSRRDKMQPKDAAAFMGVQFLAGIIAGLTAHATTDKSFYFDYELSKGAGASLILEAICTCALCMTVLATATSRDAPNQYFGFAIGLTVTACAITGGEFNQGSFNPAVTVGVNIANYGNNKTKDPSGGGWILFLLAPFLGAFMASGIFYFTRIKEFRDWVPGEQAQSLQEQNVVGKPGTNGVDKDTE